MKFINIFLSFCNLFILIYSRKKYSPKNEGQIVGLVKKYLDDHPSQDYIGNWKDIDDIFHKLISECLKNYYDHLNEKIIFKYFTTGENLYIPPNREVTDTGYQIQKTLPHQGYVWHQDYMTRRLITFIVYLNTVEEGWTQFMNGDQISPKAGRAVMFPATWTYIHQGYPPRQTKYLMTGWLHEREDES